MKITTSGKLERQIVNGIPKKMNITAANITTSCMKTYRREKLYEDEPTPTLIDDKL